MTHRATDHPVRLLCDQRGIYGIGCESEAIFTVAARKKLRCCFAPTGSRLTASSRLANDYRRTSSRAIPTYPRRLFPAGSTSHPARRAGIPWPPLAQLAWWSHDPAQQKRNRQKYHGLRLASLAIVNGLIAEALTVGDQDALKRHVGSVSARGMGISMPQRAGARFNSLRRSRPWLSPFASCGALRGKQSKNLWSKASRPGRSRDDGNPVGMEKI